MQKQIILTLIQLFITSTLLSQNKEFTKENFKDQPVQLKEALRQIKEGDGFYKKGPAKFKLALPYYEKAYLFNPDNAELNYKLGTCYLHSNFKSKAITYLEKAYKLNSDIAPDIHYALGRGYHLAMEWEKAIDAYLKDKQISMEQQDDIKLNDVNKKIAECRNGLELSQNPARVFIDNIGSQINTLFPEYGPSISADEDVLIFTSKREGSTGEGIDESTNDYYEDVYISYKKSGLWMPAKNIGPPINTIEHDATVGLSPDGQKMFVYKGEKGDGNIYECNLTGDSWSEPEKLPKAINSSAHETSASLSYDGKTIYFVSNREGGLGGRDIYYCTKNEKNKWEKALNPGSAINTPYDEEGVFMLPDGKTMYFSSQGHNSMGGYDIFKSVYENGTWSKPENLGIPINTPDDDVFFVVSASGKHGYYASIRSDGQGEKDLYMVTFLGPEKPVLLNTEDELLAGLASPVSEVSMAPTLEIETNQVTLLKGVITDAITQQPVEALIEITDNQKNTEIASFKSNGKSGKYLVSLPSGVNYGIAVKADGYLFHSENFDIPAGADYQEVVKDVQLKNITVGNKIILKNIFYDFGKATLRQESTAELERLVKLLSEVPSLKIELSGHTDNVGTEQYNMGLSENRAQSVVNYLIEKGISKDRLQYKGYGFSQPVAGNDTEDGRQMNRRTEFKILSR